MSKRNLSLILVLVTFLFSTNVFSRTFQFFQDKKINLNHKAFKFSAAKSGALAIEFSFSSMDATSDLRRVPFEFEGLSIKGLDQTHIAGAPALPFKSFIVVGSPEEFSLSYEEGPLFSIPDILPAPAQKMPCRCDKKEEDIPFVFNNEKYKVDNNFLLSKIYLGKYRGVSLTKITLTPMKYSDLNTLRVYPRLKVTIQKRSGFVKLFNHKSITQNKNYLIIAPLKFQNDLAPLINHKKSQGFNVIFKTQASMGNDYNSLKTSIHNYYKRNNFSYALLVGHEESFPTDYVETSNLARTPSDLGYFLMDGSNDKVPDVFYGRMNVSSSKDVRNQIYKTLEYEKRSWLNSSGFSRMLGIASDEGYNPSDVEYTELFAKPLQDSLDKTVDYILQESSRSTATNIVKSIDKGAYWINYIGHGSGTSWPSINTGEFNVDDIKTLSPGAVKPVLIDVACQNGKFSNEGRLGERFMNETNQGQPVGSVAYYGGSVDISWHPPAIMAKGINLELANNRPKSIGEVLLAGQLHLLSQYDDTKAAEENLVWYHLQGDPTLQLQY
ncbi:MAG: hypothetical protein HN576_16425 [Bacteriovoracaceae bacterium]|jgi:hypothetical protein|nr:hypothetical protein [Bacteriovoracaceae bacterium]